MGQPQLTPNGTSTRPLFIRDVTGPRTKVSLTQVLLLVATVFTTLLAGGQWHSAFVRDFTTSLTGSLGNGLPYAFWILTILLAHEMGHYVGCRIYGISATLPYVIPFPPFVMPFGTMGAVIRIRAPFMNRQQLFDVGIAGPLAGFVVLVPALALGLSLSTEFDFSADTGSVLMFGEPLLFKWMTPLFFEGNSVHLNLHPIGWAAWFGLLATGLNLLPMGQLDGGHVVYAVFGRRWHRIVSNLTFFSLLGLALWSWPTPAYVLFAIIVRLVAFRHPRPVNEEIPLDRNRLVIAVLGLLILLITFIPVPVTLPE